jgi:hypothetical protein
VPTTGDEAGHPDGGQIESTTLSTTPSVVPLVGEREDAPPIERPDDLPLTPTDAPSPIDQPTPLPSLRTVEYAGPPPTSFTPPVVSRTTLPTVEVRTRPSTSVQRAVTGASETTPLTSKQQPGLHQPSTPTRPASSETPLTERVRPSMELPIVEPVVATRPVSQALPAIQRVAAVPGADLSPPSHDLAGVVRPAATSAGVRRGAMRESGQPTDPPNMPMRPSAQRVLDPVRTPATPEPGRVSVLPLQRMFADVAPAPQSDAGSAGFAVQRDQEAGTSLVWQRVSGDEGVVAPADRPAEDEPPSSSPAPATPSPPSEPAVASEPAAEAAAPPTEAPAATPAASTPTASGAAAPPSAAELDEMAKRLYEPVSARLRSELWLDLERHGLVTARSR